MLFALKTALKLAQIEPLAGEIDSAFDFKKPEYFAHFRNRGEFKDMDDATIDELFKDSAFTIYHPTGTAKMGPRSDPLAVVDDRLKVHGVAGLRVVDASIMPVIVRGHPQAAVVAIAEKASHMILADTEITLVNELAYQTNGNEVVNGKTTIRPDTETPANAELESTPGIVVAPATPSDVTAVDTSAPAAEVVPTENATEPTTTTA